MRKQGRLDALTVTMAVVALAAFAAIPFWLRSMTAREVISQLSSAAPSSHRVATFDGRLVFHDAQAQSEQFIGYYNSIQLTAEQEEIKRRALEPMPAACCQNSSAYTCCCPCNLSKTIWGLSNYAIARLGADEKQLRQIVYSWMSFVNPNGFSGEACYQGGCNGSFPSGGCGGMLERDLNA